MPVDTAELHRITALDPMHIGSIVQHKDDGVYGIIVRGDGSLPEGCHYVYWYGNEEGDHWGLPYHAEYLIPVIPALLDELDDACHDLAAFYAGCAACHELAELDAARAELDTIRGALAAQEARDLAATERVGETPYGCDTSEHLADLLLQARARIAELERSVKFSEDWYGLRFERLRVLAEDHGLLTEYCNIVANGSADVAEQSGQPVRDRLAEKDARIAELEAELASACRDLAVYSESCAAKDKRIAELEAALRRRTAERDASDNMLRNVGNALSGRVTMQGRTDAS
ncbi:MAG: hypothetical protein WC455_26315 [Dehalococcoidia bacterium]|jgi:uncharacterized coiled-coil protein SlyX